MLEGTALGTLTELMVEAEILAGSDGHLLPSRVEPDVDHRDLVVAVKGKGAFASLQAKACFHLGASGFVQSNATYFESSIPRDPSWIYVVVLVLDLAPVVWWLVPAPDFNRLTSHSPARGGREVELHFRAHPERDDAFTPFRAQTRDVGPRLLALINALPPNTKPLPGARLVLATRPGLPPRARP